MYSYFTNSINFRNYRYNYFTSINLTLLFISTIYKKNSYRDIYRFHINVFNLFFVKGITSVGKYPDWAITPLWNLSTGENVSPYIIGHKPNIYPVWERWNNLLEVDLLPFFIGTGLGSASAINNFYSGSFEMANPNSNIIRLFYENGIIGILFFIGAFIYPIKLLKLPRHLNNKIIVSTFFILGAFFSHRSSVLYIFLGLSLVVLNQWSLINDRTNFIRG